MSMLTVQSTTQYIELVDSATGVHTQNIESYWNRVKIKIKCMRGCHEEQLASYLDEYMYRERYGRTAREVFDSPPVSCVEVLSSINMHVCVYMTRR